MSFNGPSSVVRRQSFIVHRPSSVVVRRRLNNEKSNYIGSNPSICLFTVALSGDVTQLERWETSGLLDSWAEMSVRVQKGISMVDTIGHWNLIPMSYLKHWN